MYYGARYYDKYLGTFISPDPVIPDPTEISSYHRYLYGLGNPLKYTDPSGYDPLDAEWQTQFESKHGSEPQAEDILIRLFSIAFPDEWDYNNFYDSEDKYISGSIAAFFKEPDITGIAWDDIPEALFSMAGWYTEGETQLYIRDIGTLFGGLMNRIEEPCSWSAVSYEDNPARDWLYVGPGSMPSEYHDDESDSNIHHWAWGVVLGSATPPGLGVVINTAREYYTAHQQRDIVSQPDIRLGNQGARFGTRLSRYSLRIFENGLWNSSVR